VIERSINLRDATAELPGWEYWFFRLPASIVTADVFMVLTPGEETWLVRRPGDYGGGKGDVWRS